MWKVALIPLIPFLLAALNHYLNHKRQLDQDKVEQKLEERRTRNVKRIQPEVRYDHEYPEDR